MPCQTEVNRLFHARKPPFVDRFESGSSLWPAGFEEQTTYVSADVICFFEIDNPWRNVGNDQSDLSLEVLTSWLFLWLIAHGEVIPPCWLARDWPHSLIIMLTPLLSKARGEYDGKREVLRTDACIKFSEVSRGLLCSCRKDHALDPWWRNCNFPLVDLDSISTWKSQIWTFSTLAGYSETTSSCFTSKSDILLTAVDFTQWLASVGRGQRFASPYSSLSFASTPVSFNHVRQY